MFLHTIMFLHNNKPHTGYPFYIILRITRSVLGRIIFDPEQSELSEARIQQRCWKCSTRIWLCADPTALSSPCTLFSDIHASNIPFHFIWEVHYWFKIWGLQATETMWSNSGTILRWWVFCQYFSGIINLKKKKKRKRWPWQERIHLFSNNVMVIIWWWLKDTFKALSTKKLWTRP